MQRNQFTPNEIKVINDVAYITLYKNGNIPIAEAIIDVEDISKISGYKWHFDHGYVGTKIKKNGKQYLHRLLLDNPNSDIDHKNGNTLDNRRANLRRCSHSENLFNRNIQCNNTSGFRGVTWDKSRKKWLSYIKLNNKSKYLGRFDSVEDAAIAYNNAALKYRPGFARLNVLDVSIA